MSIETALAVDYARRGALLIPLVLLGLIVMPLWILGTIGMHAPLDSTTKEGVVLHVTLTLTMGFVAAVVIMQAQGSLARFFQNCRVSTCSVRPPSSGATRSMPCSRDCCSGT